MYRSKQSVDSYVIEFITKWKDLILPIITDLKNQKRSWIDLTDEFKDKKGCNLTHDGILSGKRVYGLIFKNCRGMANKWELTLEGNIKKDFYKKPIVKVCSTSVALVPLDLVVEFISTDEILPVSKNYASPYGLGQAWIEKLMKKLGCAPEKDLIFIFVSYQEEIPFKTRRFLNELEYIIDGGYLKKKGFLQLDGPQWQTYFPSQELTNTSKLFLSAAVDGSFNKRRLLKLRNLFNPRQNARN